MNHSNLKLTWLTQHEHKYKIKPNDTKKLHTFAENVQM